ncbi:MAG: hypothetical protein ACJAZX_000781 [Rickettsiales bacterium]
MTIKDLICFLKKRAESIEEEQIEYRPMSESGNSELNLPRKHSSCLEKLTLCYAMIDIFRKRNTKKDGNR